MMANGLMDYKMELVNNIIMMDLIMRDILLIVRKKFMAGGYLQMDHIMKEILKMIKKMVMVLQNIEMVSYIRVCTIMVTLKVKEKNFKKMEQSLMVFLSMGIKKMESRFLMMVLYMRVNSYMEKN